MDMLNLAILMAENLCTLSPRAVWRLAYATSHTYTLQRVKHSCGHRCLRADTRIHPVGPGGRLPLPCHRPGSLLDSPSSIPKCQDVLANTLYKGWNPNNLHARSQVSRTQVSWELPNGFKVHMIIRTPSLLSVFRSCMAPQINLGCLET